MSIENYLEKRENRQAITCRFDAEIYDQICAIAEQAGVKTPRVVEALVRAGLVKLAEDSKEGRNSRKR